MTEFPYEEWVGVLKWEIQGTSNFPIRVWARKVIGGIQSGGNHSLKNLEQQLVKQ